MRHVITALAILLAVVALCVFSAWYVRDGAGETLTLLQTAEMAAAAGEFHRAEAAVAAAKTRWETLEAPFGVLISHEEMDQITQCFSALLQYARTEDGDEFAAVFAQTRFLLEHLRLMQLPTVYNVM